MHLQIFCHQLSSFDSADFVLSRTSPFHGGNKHSGFQAFKALEQVLEVDKFSGRVKGLPLEIQEELQTRTFGLTWNLLRSCCSEGLFENRKGRATEGEGRVDKINA